ncbi:hypothetical protein BN946_scf184937.g11 [Trametes cinnabarina]|uniref:AB hydrolase-1 domain-containing protein n=1 Tax=Pycnoporus cinnabarinus TaxID=5643 RepID=A0A060SPD8_PYCCI|nr:hypothetical protein BN946_scf184937.g11 [Trametes cinnabarina]
MIPFAENYNTRIMLLNRRDYPGARPYTAQELALVKPVKDDADGQAIERAWQFMRDRAAELYEWLARAVKEGKILPYDPLTETGGVIIAASDVHGVNLTSVVRRVVFFDPPYHSLGYPPPAKPWNPLIDPSYSPEEVVVKFAEWVSGYYRHGATPDELEYRVPLRDPSPTLLRLTQEERDRALWDGPGSPGGSDDLVVKTGVRVGLFDRMRRAALYLPQDRQPPGERSDTWRNTEVRHICCDQSVWDMPWGTWALRAELEKADRDGVSMRKIQILQVHGANHFVHWDQPERALKAIVCEAGDGNLNVLSMDQEC